MLSKLERYIPIAIFLGSLFVFFLNINSFPLRNWDEAWYAEISKNLASGEHGFLFPFWNGRYYFDKPPLYFWLSYPFFKFFGSGEWQARIVSVVSFAGILTLLYLIGKKTFSKLVGLISIAIFLTLGQVYIRLSHGNLDALLIFFFLSTFYFYLLSKERGRFIYLSGLACGLGFLVKGWGVGLFPLAAIGVYEIFKSKRLPTSWQKLLLVTILVSSWWHILGIVRFGKVFFDWYVGSPFGDEFSSRTNLSFFRYWIDFIRDVGFWWIFLFLGLLYAKRIERNHFKVLTSFVFIVLAFIFVISFSRDRFGWYILPVYPFISLLIAYFVMPLIKKSKLILAIFIIVLGLSFFWGGRIESFHPDRSRQVAELGIFTRMNISKDTTLVLDDRDFASFLYYSGREEIFVVSRKGGKPGEWWIISYDDLSKFIPTKKPLVLITREYQNFSKILGKPILEKEHLGYKYLRIN